jgi:hypothetical protein
MYEIESVSLIDHGVGFSLKNTSIAVYMEV